MGQTVSVGVTGSVSLWGGLCGSGTVMRVYVYECVLKGVCVYKGRREEVCVSVSGMWSGVCQALLVCMCMCGGREGACVCVRACWSVRMCVCMCVYVRER